MSLYDRQRSSVVTLKGQGAPSHISRTPGQEVAQIEAELRTLGLRRGHKCPFCRLPVPDKLRWKTQGGGKDCPLLYRGNCPNAKPRVNALGRRLQRPVWKSNFRRPRHRQLNSLVDFHTGEPCGKRPRPRPSPTTS